MKSAFTALATLLAATAHAHEGHGLAGPHWHATDVVGLLIVGGVAAAVLYWLTRGGK